MTTGNTIDTTPEPEPFIRLPDPPEESKDGMVFDHPGRTGNAYFLDQYIGDLKTTVHNSWRYISPVVTGDPTGLFAPDQWSVASGQWSVVRKTPWTRG